MKKLVAGLLAALCINALAVTPTALITPSPLSIVLAYSSYMKDQKKVYYIKVQSQAPDFELAKKQAFRLASEQVAGTVVLSESELRNSKLTRDEIITYSSGLIDEYKIAERYDGPGFVKLTMEVWIVESIMAQRLLAKSATERGVDGNALSTRVESILDSGQRGDAIIRAIMRDYPRRAFRVALVGQPTINLDAYRNTVIGVEFKISWDEKFVNALNEAARETGAKPCSGFLGIGCPPSPPYWIMDGGFHDATKLNIVDDHIRNSYSRILVELQDINGQTIKRDCYPLNMQDFYYRNSNGQFESVGFITKAIYHAKSQINLKQNTPVMAKAENIRVEVVTSLQCRNI